MPKKLQFETDLVNVNIQRKDYDRINRHKRGTEPFYSILHRVLGLQDTTKEDLEYLLNEQIQSTQGWLKRALEAEAKLLKERQTTFE